MYPSSRAALLLAALAIAWPEAALAEPPPAAAPSLEQVEAARAPFREARELHRQGRLNEAVARMLDAYHVASTPVIALEAGRFLVEAGRLVGARDLLREVSVLPMSPRESDAGREARREAAALATQLDARIPKISLAERPPGVDVLLDGKPLAPADSAAWQGVDPGGHAIAVSVDDHVCASIAITLAEGQVRTIDLREATLSCRPTSPAPPPPPPEAPRPALEEPLPPPAAARDPGSWRWGGAALAGAGAIAAGVGTYVVVHAKADYDSVSSECTARGCTADAFDVRHSAHQQANVGTVAMGLGAAAVGTGVLWFVLGRSSGAGAPAPRIGVGPSSVSLVVPVP